MTKPVRELKLWDKVKCEVNNSLKVSQEILTYDWMDWWYAKLLDKEWTIMNAKWYLKKEWDFYEFVSGND